MFRGNDDNYVMYWWLMDVEGDGGKMWFSMVSNTIYDAMRSRNPRSRTIASTEKDRQGFESPLTCIPGRTEQTSSERKTQLWVVTPQCLTNQRSARYWQHGQRREPESLAVGVTAQDVSPHDLTQFFDNFKRGGEVWTRRVLCTISKWWSFGRGIAQEVGWAKIAKHRLGNPAPDERAIAWQHCCIVMYIAYMRPSGVPEDYILWRQAMEMLSPPTCVKPWWAVISLLTAIYHRQPLLTLFI